MGRSVLLSALALGVVACGDGINDAPPREDVEVAIDLSQIPNVTTLIVEVEAADISAPLVFDLTVRSGTATGTIAVPVGRDRTITVRAFDADGRETHRGSATVDVIAGTTPLVTIPLTPLAGGPIDFDTVTIVIVPEDGTLLIGESLQLGGAVLTISGDTLSDPLIWSTPDSAVAVVDTAGIVTGVGPGDARIFATFGEKTSTANIRVMNAVATVSPTGNALVFGLQVDVIPEAAIAVEYWTGTEPHLTVESPSATSHPLLLARLLSSTTYEYAVTLTAGTRGSPTLLTGTFTTDTLPDDLEAVRLTSTGASTAQLVMLELRIPTFQGFVAVDAIGRVVWYHRTGGSSWGWTRRANGNFVFLDTRDGLTEVTPTGDVVANLTRAGGEVIHHDVIATPDNTLYFMTRHSQVADDGKTWVGERIWEWNPDSGDLEIRWNAFDFFSPVTDAGPLSKLSDWLHANSLNIGASGNVLVSSPFLNQVIALTPDFSTIAWRLGGPNATFVPDSLATFAFQHSASEVAPGRVLLFDNRGGPTTAAPYSRALELSLGRGIAQAGWSFRAPNDNYAAIISSARRMANGHTMVAFGPGPGLRGSIGPIEVYEVMRDGTIQWHLVVTGPNHMYRATPFDDIAGEREK